MRSIIRLGAAWLAWAMLASSTGACPPGSEDAQWASPPAADSAQGKALSKARLTRGEQEKELKKIRAKYFRGVRNTETRQVGMLKLREFADPAIFPSLIKLFGEEDAETQNAVLDHLRDLKMDEADASLAWAAVFGKDKAFRAGATSRLTGRTKEVGSVTDRVKWVVALGLKDRSNDSVAAGAQLAQVLKLYDAIPMLINAQVTQGAGPTRADDGGDAALAYILVGTQQAFVSGLTPVVGDSAVGFDPQLSVVTNGVVLRVIDAVVITYRTDVNAALIGLSTDGWGGQSTASLGWDQRAWRQWYANTFVPYRRDVDAKATAAKS